MNKLAPQKRLPIYGLFLALGAFITFFTLMASPSDPKNAVILGYSLERILLSAAILAPGIALLFITLNLFRKPEQSRHFWETIFQKRNSSGKTFVAATSVFLLLWVLLFLPSYRLGIFASYISRLLPILIWMLAASGVTVILLLFEREEDTAQVSLLGNRMILKISLIVLFILLMAGLFVAVTGIGTSYPADYWYGAGVPILGLQILVSLLVGAIYLAIEKRIEKLNHVRLDFIIFVVIWILSAFFWAREPLSPNYFMPDTANNPIYPYSDGATFDQGAQYALIGQGLFNGFYFDRVLYSAFLTYLHLILGQDFAVLMTAQAGFFAVFPAVVYLIGRELHSRVLGISAGVLMSIRGLNAIIAAKWIDTASPKMTLTDFPTAIGISIFLLILLKWFKEPAKISMLVWAGAVFGLTLMVRVHVLTLLPVVFVFIPIVMKLRWKQIVLVGLLVLLGLLTATLPWEFRNQSRGIPMFYTYYYRIEVILLNRYGIDMGSYTPLQDISRAQAESLSHILVRQRKFNLNLNAEPLCVSAPCSIANHLVHNVITSFVSLPSSFVFHDLWNTVKADTPYWKKDWREGSVGKVELSLLILNLAMLSLGIGALWKRGRFRSLLPLILFLAYLLTNSLGLTSGGRYIAPVDWILYLYFIAGSLQLVIWFLGMQPAEIENDPPSMEYVGFPRLQRDTYSKLIPSLAFILVIGMLLPVSEMFIKPRFQARTSTEIFAKLDEAGLLEQSGYLRDDLTAFLSQPTAMIREGRALYPRYYPDGDGEQDRSTYYRYLDYQRLVFAMIGPYSDNAEGVVIPGFPPPLSMHAEDVIVLGCWNTTYYAPFIDAVVVFVTSGEGYVYTRSPGAPLQCPLPEPN